MGSLNWTVWLLVSAKWPLGFSRRTVVRLRSCRLDGLGHSHAVRAQVDLLNHLGELWCVCEIVGRILLVTCYVVRVRVGFLDSLGVLVGCCGLSMNHSPCAHLDAEADGGWLWKMI